MIAWALWPSRPAQLTCNIGGAEKERPPAVQISHLQQDPVPARPEPDGNLQLVGDGYVAALAFRYPLAVHPENVSIIGTEQ